MRFFAVACAVVALPLAARAQSTLAMTGTCDGGMNGMKGSVGLAVPQSDGTFLTISTAQVTTAFGAAECQCAPAPNNPNIKLEIKLTTQLMTSLGSAQAEIWVGDSSCQNSMTRTSNSNTGCERIVQTNGQDFTTASTARSADGLLRYSIPANKLIDPIRNSCDPAVAGVQHGNGIYVFVFTDATMPLATCYLTLSERLQGPDAVTNVSGSAGDGAVTLNWTVPSQVTFAPTGFQVLCADDCGNPITDNVPTQIYSACNNGVLSRRPNLTQGGSSPITGTDGGTTTGTGDLGTMSLPINLGSRVPWSNVTACNPDGGTSLDFAITTPDGGVGSSNPLDTLDPRFICASLPTPTANSARITGLINSQRYHFAVLAVDNYGNATPSPAIDATPEATEDLWRRYRDAGGGAGGCFIATAAFGSYENRWVWVLRDFRDQVLLPRDWGRGFVDWYYAHSPSAAAWIGAHGWARGATRVALVPVIAGAWFWLYVPPWQKAFLVTLALALLLRKRIRAALRRGTPA